MLVFEIYQKQKKRRDLDFHSSVYRSLRRRVFGAFGFGARHTRHNSFCTSLQRKVDSIDFLRFIMCKKISMGSNIYWFYGFFMDQLDIYFCWSILDTLMLKYLLVSYWGREAKCLDIGLLYFEMNDFPEKIAMAWMDRRMRISSNFPQVVYQVGLM